MRPLPQVLDDLAQTQFGLVTHAQLQEVLTSATIFRLRRAGILLDIAPRVYRVIGAVSSWRQRALAACLSVGDPVALSGLAAAYLWRIEGIARPALQLTVPPGRHNRSAIVAVRRQPLMADDITRRDGVPATTAARTIIDLSRGVGQPLLQRAYDDLVRRGALRPDELQQRLRTGALPERRMSHLEGLLGRNRTLGGSVKEDWVVDTLINAGFPPPERHVRVLLDGQIRELDCAWPELRIAIEYDSWEFHAGETRFHGDRDKFAALALTDWIVLPVTAAWDEAKLVRQTRKAFALRGAVCP